ncbi:MAG: hypothetical protein AAGI44_06275, partial [Pseudomonadota bacterium]
MDVEQAGLPPVLCDVAESAWLDILDRAAPEIREKLERAVREPELAAQVCKVLACSPFVTESVRRNPALFFDLLSKGLLGNSMSETAFT